MRSVSGWRTVTASVAFLGAGWMLLRLGHLEWLRVDWSDPSAWLASTEIEVALAALARWAGLALLGWIAVSTVVYGIARLAGVEAGSVGWLSIGPFRRAVDALLAGYLMLGSVAPAGALTDPQSPPATAAPREAVDPGYVPVPAGFPLPAGEEDEAAEEEEVEPEEGAEGGTRRGVVTTVSPGDNLWELASDRLARALGRAPTDAEVAPYWVEVVEENRNRIRSGDPDLVFPGEEVVLPPPPSS